MNKIDLSPGNFLRFSLLVIAVILLFLMIVFRVLITTMATPEAVTGNAIKLPYSHEDVEIFEMVAKGHVEKMDLYTKNNGRNLEMVSIHHPQKKSKNKRQYVRTKLEWDVNMKFESDIGPVNVIVSFKDGEVLGAVQGDIIKESKNIR